MNDMDWINDELKINNDKQNADILWLVHSTVYKYLQVKNEEFSLGLKYAWYAWYFV